MACSYVQMICIVSCFLLTGPNKEKIVPWTLPIVSSECVSQYRDLFTTENKELSFFCLFGR